MRATLGSLRQRIQEQQQQQQQQTLPQPPPPHQEPPQQATGGAGGQGNAAQDPSAADGSANSRPSEPAASITAEELESLYTWVLPACLPARLPRLPACRPARLPVQLRGQHFPSGLL